MRKWEIFHEHWVQSKRSRIIDLPEFSPDLIVTALTELPEAIEKYSV